MPQDRGGRKDKNLPSLPPQPLTDSFQGPDLVRGTGHPRGEVEGSVRILAGFPAS